MIWYMRCGSSTIKNSNKIMNIDVLSSDEKKMFEQFAQEYDLTVNQQQQFLLYAQKIVETNKKFNITAILDFKSIVKDHFKDSLSLSKATDLTNVSSIIDVGTGGGFPIVPLKIAYPHLDVTCIEVNQKKVAFLYELAELFSFDLFTVIDDDWRTFLRHNTQSVDMVIARASLSVDELFRMFKGSSALNNSQLVYWASERWEPAEKQQEKIKHQYVYKIGGKKRKLIFFQG